MRDWLTSRPEAMFEELMDESVVEAPQTFRLDRPSQHDLHFGAVLHQCLGIHIADAHMTEMVGRLLTLPGLN